MEVRSFVVAVRLPLYYIACVVTQASGVLDWTAFVNQPAEKTIRVRLYGELDLSSEARLMALLLTAEDADNAIIDMSETTYIDSTVLSCLVKLKNRLIARGGRVYLTGVQPNVRRVFTITGLDRVFEISTPLCILKASPHKGEMSQTQLSQSY